MCSSNRILRQFTSVCWTNFDPLTHSLAEWCITVRTLCFPFINTCERLQQIMSTFISTSLEIAYSLKMCSVMLTLLSFYSAFHSQTTNGHQVIFGVISLNKQKMVGTFRQTMVVSANNNNVSIEWAHGDNIRWMCALCLVLSFNTQNHTHSLSQLKRVKFARSHSSNSNSYFCLFN